MDFLRKNMFYVSLVSAVLVAFILTMVIGSPKGDETAVAAEARKKTQEAMVGVTAGTRVNDNVLKAERARNEALRKQASGSLQISLQHNNEKLVNKDDKSSPLLRYSSDEPVFPLNRDMFKSASTYMLIAKYQNQLKSLTTPLRPITPYTLDELNQAIQRQVRLLENKRPVTDTPAGGAGAGPGAAAVVTDEARKEGVRVMRLQKAGIGGMYVKEDALEPLISSGRSSISPAELWWMQMNLWIQSDIIAAIAETNGKGNVMSSPVKHLIKIKIDDKYVGGKSVGITAGSVTPAVDKLTPVPVPPVFPQDPSMPVDPGMQDIPGSVTIDTGVILTGRTSSKNYDVIRYTLTVVMPTRYIAQLQWNLMARNYHTVLNVSDISEVKDDPAVYYGNEPVMKVTLEGEALFLTAWERGTVDPKDPAKFVYPPLMPVEILKTLPQTALRPEDIERMNKPDVAVPK